MNINVVTSPGGIQAWLVEEHAVPMLALRFAFEGGSVQEPAGKEGLANFLAQMLVEGAGHLAGISFQERIKDIAARLGFGSGKEVFSGSLAVLTESRDEAMQLLNIALAAPRLEADAVERVRQRILVGLTRAMREPENVAHREWDAIAFAGHPYARPTSGTTSSIRKITADDLEALRRRIFARDALKVVAVGDITPEQLAALLDDVFGILPASADLTPVAQVAPVAGGRLAVIEMDVPQSVAVFGMGGIPRTDPDYTAAIVLNHIVGGGGFSSRLMEEVRVKRGLAYGVSTSLSSSRYASVLRGSVATRNDMVGQSIDVIRAELQTAADGEFDERDLDNAKSYLIGSYPLRFDSNAKIASQLLGLRLDGYDADYVDKRNVEIAAVSLDDVKRVGKRLLDPQNLVITVVGKPSLGAEQSAAAPVTAASAA